MIKKLQVIKSDVLIPIQISAAFYRNLQECSGGILDSMTDPKQALINIEKASKDPNFKLSLQEYTLNILMNIIYEVETVAKSDENAYTEMKEFEVKD